MGVGGRSVDACADVWGMCEWVRVPQPGDGVDVGGEPYTGESTSSLSGSDVLQQLLVGV